MGTEALCAHGLLGFCSDCPPRSIDTQGALAGAPTAIVRRKREGLSVVVERRNADGSYGWFTHHLTRRGARRAAALFERTGETKGRRP